MDGEDVRNSAAELSFGPLFQRSIPLPFSSSFLLSSPLLPLFPSRKRSLSHSFLLLAIFFFSLEFFFFFFSTSRFVFVCLVVCFCIFLFWFFFGFQLRQRSCVCGLAAVVWRRIFVAHHAGALCSSARVGSQW